MHFFIDENFKYEQYRDKSVLVIGGGPSTLEVKWENLKVDYIWSCTNFFLNERLLNIDLDLVSLGNLQDYYNRDLLTYMDTHPNTKVLFETDYLYPKTLQENAHFTSKYSNRIYRGEGEKSYTGIVGPPARLITLAANVGFKDIYFVGIDGFDPQLKNVHAFTKEDGLREGAVHNKYELYYNAHTSFAKNIYKDFGNRINFHNLGEAATCHNIMSFVSKEYYPLNNQLYEKLK